MLWYLLKTWPGREEELVDEIHRTVPSYLYREAFVLYSQRFWRRQGRSIVHSEPLFKGCVFLTCRRTEPLFGRLERVPDIARLMAAGDISVFPLTEEDAGFLERISGDGHVVRLSHVLREKGPEKEEPWFGKTEVRQNPRQNPGQTEETGTDGKPPVYRISGPLEECLEDIEGIEFRKRFAKLRRKLWGEEQVLALGIVLNEDVEQKVFVEGLKVSPEIREQGTLLEIIQDFNGKNIYREKKQKQQLEGWTA